MDGSAKPFGLDTVLEYRRRLEDLAQQRLFQARKDRDTIASRLEEERQTQADLQDETERKQAEGIDITDLIFRGERLLRLDEIIQAIEKKLKEKEEVVHEIQADLLKKSKERQIMEKLKEQQNRNWRLYLDKKEAAQLDEIAVIRHSAEERNQSGSE